MKLRTSAIVLCMIFLSHSAYAQSTHQTVSPTAGDGFELLQGFDILEPTTADTGKALSGFGGAGHMILLTDGRLGMAYASGGKISISFSSDSGATWTPRRMLEIELPENGRTSRPNLIEAADGVLWLFYYGWEKYEPKDPPACVNNLYAMHSADAGGTWSKAHRIYSGYVGMLQGAIRTRTASMIVPLCIYTDVFRYSGLCLVSQDEGKTWKQSNQLEIADEANPPTTQPLSPSISRGAIEPTIAETRDGRLLMLIRTVFGAFYQSHSDDGGLTWSAPQRSSLDCGGPGNMVRLPSGRLAVVWNPANLQSPETRRWGSPIGYDSQSIAISDDGINWKITREFVRQIPGKTRVVHSMITGLPDGTLLITLPSRSTLIRVKEETLLQ